MLGNSDKRRVRGRLSALGQGNKTLRYHPFAMFDVLVYLYENYWRPDACPGHEQLTRKLTSVGFESEEIADALILDELFVAEEDRLIH